MAAALLSDNSIILQYFPDIEKTYLTLFNRSIKIFIFFLHAADFSGILYCDILGFVHFSGEKA